MLNIKKILPKFEQVEEYLYDEYLEYFKQVDSKFFTRNNFKIFSKVIQNNQKEFFKYILNNFIIGYNFILYLLREYKGTENIKENLELLQNKFNLLKNYFINDNYFGLILIKSSFDYILEIQIIRENNNLPNVNLIITKFNIKDFYDKRVIKWLIYNNFFKFADEGEKTIWIKKNIEYFEQIYSLDLMLDKLNFNKSNLSNVFDYNYKINGKYLSRKKIVILYLIKHKCYDTIYKLFEYVNPNLIIFNEFVANKIIRFLAYNKCDNKFVIFMIKILLKLKYNMNIKRCFNKFDESIKYELVKLKLIPPTNSNYYQIYKNIKFQI